MKKIRTHYDNLQVSRTASDAVIRAAYRGLSQQYHPDRNPDRREDAERTMQIINEAYAVLSDPVRRRDHDAWIAHQEIEAAEEVKETTRQTARAVLADEEIVIKPKRRIAIGYFILAVAMLIFALSAWFSPLGGHGWAGRGFLGIDELYWQIFMRFIGFPFGLWLTIYMGTILFSGTLMILSPSGIRFTDTGGRMFRWEEVSHCTGNGKHIVLSGLCKGKRWEKRILRSMIDSDVDVLITDLKNRTNQHSEERP